MKRRLTGNICTGLGGNTPDIFDNVWTDNENFNNEVKLFFDDVLKNIHDFDDIGGFDFKLYLREDGFRILFGIEPTYMYDPYVCYCFDSNEEDIYIQKGRANGYYGTDIIIDTELTYKEGTCTKKFIPCIENHLNSLMNALV